jgi:hypothetical protein
METHLTPVHRLRLWLLSAALGLTAWSALGTLGDDRGYTDALYWPDYTIPFIEPGGVLDEAGFQPGDSVVSVEGIPVEELGMYSRWPRSLSRRPGESIEMVVERDGVEVSGRIVYRERPASVRAMWLGASFVILAFLWIGVGTLFTVPTVHAARLAIIGLALGLSLPGPDLGTWNGVRDHVQLLAELLWLILLVRFFFFFPTAKPWARRPLTRLLLWGPWFVLLCCLIVELAFHPRYYHSFGGLFGILLLGYLLALVGVVVDRALRAGPEERRTSGLSVIVWGFGVVLVANVLALGTWLVPGLTIPGSAYAPLLFALVPMAMAVGISRHAPEVPGQAHGGEDPLGPLRGQAPP